MMLNFLALKTIKFFRKNRPSIFRFFKIYPLSRLYFCLAFFCFLKGIVSALEFRLVMAVTHIAESFGVMTGAVFFVLFYIWQDTLSRGFSDSVF